MTIRVTSNGVTRLVSDVEAVETALRLAQIDPRILSPDFIPLALKDGCSIERIVAIAAGREHLLGRPRKRPMVAERHSA